MTKKKQTRQKRATSNKKEKHPRGMWSGTISFGLVNIGVRVLSAKEQKDLHFTLIDPTNFSPIGYKYYNKSTGDEISHNDAVKAYEYKSGQYVIMTDADFKKANPKATQTIDIENFVELSEIDPVFFEQAYYLLPNEGGEKGYRLLCDALNKTGKVAIAKIVMHGKQHLVALIPRGNYLLLELLHFADEVKELRELKEWKNEVTKVEAQPREVDMAEKLIADMSVKWDPENYHDTYREDLMKRVQDKVKAGKATEMTEEAPPAVDESSGKVLDLIPLLRKSLAAKPKSGKRHSPTEDARR
jgi:DNA end-binding protein Ku